MITTYDNLSSLKQEAGDEPVFFKAGTFDLLHEGHLDMLDYVASLGGVSVVGISPDSRVAQRKGPGRPIRGQARRAQDVEETGLIDYAFILPEGIFGLPRAINRLKPSAYVEHRSDSGNIRATRALLSLTGIGYVVCENSRICSTTEIITRGNYGQEQWQTP